MVSEQHLILLRTHVFTQREQAVLQELQRWTGCPVVVAADERSGSLDVGSNPKLSMTAPACERLGLYCPRDFAWRNGDYAFYLARQQYPSVTHMWLIEPDVEHSFPSYGDLFDAFAGRPDIDLLATWLAPADRDWWWYQTMPERPGEIWRCLFAMVRMSARAIDACLAARQARRRSLRDRLDWPNDEVFVATQAVNQGLLAVDLNDVGAPVYTPQTFGYTPLDGGTDFGRSDRQIYHPVLSAIAYQARLERHVTARPKRAQRYRRTLQRRLG